jgi:hypothetical protein
MLRKSRFQLDLSQITKLPRESHPFCHPFLVTMKIAAASLLFLAYEGATAFQAPMTKSQTFALKSSPESYSYSYGGNTVRDGNANTNGNVGQGDSGRVVRFQLVLCLFKP